MQSTFKQEVKKNIKNLAQDKILHDISNKWIVYSARSNYSYNFTWLGRPIIQYPQDIVAIQEIIWSTKPDLIIETGIARGGSLIFYASILELIGHGDVLGIDIVIRQNNKVEIEKHAMYKRITMIEGSSISEVTARKVHAFAENKNNIMVVLDSNHTHEHVAKELDLYSNLIRKGGYLIVCDTIIEDIPEDLFPDRPWGKGNNPKTAVWEFLRKNDRFTIDEEIHNKLLITVAPDGYLKCIKD